MGIADHVAEAFSHHAAAAAVSQGLVHLPLLYSVGVEGGGTLRI